MFVVRRSRHNPLLAPDRNHHWEAFATFNMSLVSKGRSLYGFYRAMSEKDSLREPDRMSAIGLAKSSDGRHFENRRLFIEPTEGWEKFGCEDPRVTFFEGRYYIFYTALSVFPFVPEGIRTAVAITDDLKTIKEKHSVTTFNSKAMTLFPERINGKATLLFSAQTDGAVARIVMAQADDVSEFWSPKFWEKWYAQMDKHDIEDIRRDDYDHVEIGATPIKTKEGWLLVYSHIQNFFPGSGRERLFGVEALLLDLKNPQKILGRTGGPILVPDEPYELAGHVPNVVFPSGVFLEKDVLHIYYGASDTTVCRASVELGDLVSSISRETGSTWRFQRLGAKPIIEPISNHDWEAKATFNPAAIDLGGKTHLLYRALSRDNTSTIGYASSSDGVNITERLAEPIYVPRESFETKKIDNANSGCEDPRLTKIGKNLYMCYTAFDGVGPPRVAITSITEKNFLSQNWQWEKPKLITPENVDDKDACLFPEKVSGKYLILHRIGTDICGDFLESLDFEKNKVKKCIRVFGPRTRTWDSVKVGITAPPVKTKKGWLLLYHAVSGHNHTYRVGAVLLDLKDPTTVIARSADPIFSPEEEFEKKGLVDNVVFPCGLVIRDGFVYIYYGGADRVTGVARMKLDIITDALSRSLGR